MNDEQDVYGRFKDPGVEYEHFMLRLYDLEAEAREFGYAETAISRLHEARMMFMAEFTEKFPGYGKGRALWK